MRRRRAASCGGPARTREAHGPLHVQAVEQEQRLAVGHVEAAPPAAVPRQEGQRRRQQRVGGRQQRQAWECEREGGAARAAAAASGGAGGSRGRRRFRCAPHACGVHACMVPASCTAGAGPRTWHALAQPGLEDEQQREERGHQLVAHAVGVRPRLVDRAAGRGAASREQAGGVSGAGACQSTLRHTTARVQKVRRVAAAAAAQAATSPAQGVVAPGRPSLGRRPPPRARRHHVPLQAAAGPIAGVPRAGAASGHSSLPQALHAPSAR